MEELKSSWDLFVVEFIVPLPLGTFSIASIFMKAAYEYYQYRKNQQKQKRDNSLVETWRTIQSELNLYENSADNLWTPLRESMGHDAVPLINEIRTGIEAAKIDIDDFIDHPALSPFVGFFYASIKFMHLLAANQSTKEGVDEKLVDTCKRLNEIANTSQRIATSMRQYLEGSIDIDRTVNKSVFKNYVISLDIAKRLIAIWRTTIRDEVPGSEYLDEDEILDLLYNDYILNDLQNIDESSLSEFEELLGLDTKRVKAFFLRLLNSGNLEMHLLSDGNLWRPSKVRSEIRSISMSNPQSIAKKCKTFGLPTEIAINAIIDDMLSMLQTGF